MYSKCDQVCPISFTVNVDNFTESINFNNCLNRKISIDEKGNIKKITLTEATKNQKFQHFWKIKKDDIKTCQDCEFRYICTDCRIFKSDPNDDFSKPSKCTYDPYNAVWN